MDEETMRVIKEASNTLVAMGLRINTDVERSSSYELMLAMVNQAGKAVALLRAVLENVPENQR